MRAMSSFVNSNIVQRQCVYLRLDLSRQTPINAECPSILHVEGSLRSMFHLIRASERCTTGVYGGLRNRHCEVLDKERNAMHHVADTSCNGASSTVYSLDSNNCVSEFHRGPITVIATIPHGSILAGV